MKNNGFIVAATNSGCGKTTFSLGVMRALVRRGMNVQPFKCGPDYIDTQFHSLAAGRTSVNLDTFMSSDYHVRGLFAKYDSNAEVSVVEGVMGMFDGYSKEKGSSAHISALLNLPVILLINAASSAYSVAATIYGFKNFRRDIRVAGVVFNRVASEVHFSYLKEACSDAGVECLGYIRRSDTLQTPSRYLGLSLEAKEEMERFIENAADAVEANVNLNLLLSCTQKECKMQSECNTQGADSGRGADSMRQLPPLRVSVASDEAFNFIYKENIEALCNHPRYDCHITLFSPLTDDSLPDTDLLYLPGGYPELFAEGLQRNESMRRSVAEYAAKGGRIWAECGGMIYLCNSVEGAQMCGVLPLECTMENSKLSLGYRRVRIGEMEFRGHEFHYSHIKEPRLLPSAAQQYNVRGKEVDTPLYHVGNLFASYTHLYWGENDILKLWNL